MPSWEAVDAIRTFVGSDKLLSCASGNGLWELFIQSRGVDVVATDTKPCSTYHPVEEMDAIEAVKKYADHNCLMMSWPAYDDPMAYSCLKEFTGNKLVYIGEDEYGCTGDGAFHELLKEEWKKVDVVFIRQFPGIHDALFFYTRKSKEE